MFREEEDYIHRLIRQVAEVIARIAGLRVEGKLEEATKEIGRAWELLDIPADLVARVDLNLLVSMLHNDRERLRIAARILAEEADLLTSRRDPLHAAVARRRAVELLVRARALTTDGLEQTRDDEAIASLGRLLQPSELADAMQSARSV